MSYIESSDFYRVRRERVLVIYCALGGLVLMNILTILLNYLSSNSIPLSLLALSDVSLVTVLIFVSFAHEKELLFKHFQIEQEYIIMPYISGMTIPENKIYFSAIDKIVKRDDKPDFYILMIDINKLRTFFPKLPPVPHQYVLEGTGHKLKVTNTDGYRLSILVERHDFSKESYDQLELVLKEHHIPVEFAYKISNPTATPARAK